MSSTSHAAITPATPPLNGYFDGGSNLTVTATPTSGIDGLGSLTGDCTASPCTLNNLSAARTVSASFVRYQCAPSTSTCTAGNLTQCTAAGTFASYVIPNGAADGTSTTITMNGYSCPMGCHTNGSRCADVDASNGFNAALDSPATSQTGIDLVLPASAAAPAGVVVIDTNNYDSAAGETTITDVDGSIVRVPAQLILQPNAPGILVLKVRSLTVRPGRVVEVRGMQALGIVSHYDVYLAGTLDLSAYIPGFVGACGARTRCAPGAWADATCSGRFNQGYAWGGGGGANSGGYGTPGTPSSQLAMGGEPVQLHALVGGCDGGLATNGQNNGGGAIQIVSRTRIALALGALIDVSGGGGEFVAGLSSGGGGGGAVVLQAPTLQMAAGATIAGRGGSGAATNSNSGGAANGSEGPTTGAAAAAGVTCSQCGTSGAGGIETATSVNGALGAGLNAAGGGGSVGRCRTSNRSGIFTAPAGLMKITHQAVGTLAPRSP